MNPAEVFRLRFQSLLAAGLASSPIAATVGLAAASEVWGGHAPRERPAWYVWLRDRPGAWQVELAAAGRLDVPGPGEAVVARLAVRHYPAPDAPALPGFSAEERRVAAAALDGTGTPRIDVAGAIPDALFTIGTIDWALDLESDAVVLGVASLDRLRTRTGAGELVRDVPGWSLTVPVFSALAALHAQVERRRARRILVARLPGFESVEGPGGPRDAPERAQAEAYLAFPGPDGGPERAGALLAALQDGDAEVLHDVELGDGARRPGALAADPRVALDVSRGWFGGERHAHDRALCAC